MEKKKTNTVFPKALPHFLLLSQSCIAGPEQLEAKSLAQEQLSNGHEIVAHFTHANANQLLKVDWYNNYTPPPPCI